MHYFEHIILEINSLCANGDLRVGSQVAFVDTDEIAGIILSHVWCKHPP